MAPVSTGDAWRPRPECPRRRIWTLPGSAAAARPRLDARARARGRRAPEQRAHRHGPRGRRGRSRRRRVRSTTWRSWAAPARCCMARTRCRARSTSSPTAPGSRTAGLFTAGFDGFYSSNEMASAGRSSSGCPTAAGPCRSEAAASASTTTGRRSLRGELTAVLRRGPHRCSRTRSMTVSASTSTASRIRSTRRSPGPMVRCPTPPWTVRRPICRRSLRSRHHTRSNSSTSVVTQTTWAFRTSPSPSSSSRSRCPGAGSTRCRRPTRSQAWRRGGHA